MAQPDGFSDKVAFVWKVADKLRGHFKPHEYGSVILPLLVLRRLDAVLEPTKAQVLEAAQGREDNAGTRALLRKAAGQQFYNSSPLTFTTLLNDDKNIAAALRNYINGFSPDTVEVLEEYRFADKIARLDRAGILYQVLGDFADLDVHPDRVSNEAMGYMFEELLRRFSEMSNETAGEHYTPREVIHLMVNLLFAEDTEALSGERPVRTIYDPAAGTGGMLSSAKRRLSAINPSAHLEACGQELNPETWAIARSELMIKGGDPSRMVLGNSLTEDGWSGARFDYMLANPPYGVDWKAYADPIRNESEKLGWEGRFGAGLPKVSDGMLLFLQHMISKMKSIETNEDGVAAGGGSRIGIVLSGSSLTSGVPGSSESEIRKWIIENDWLEGVIALPDQLFYNTPIGTYIWILSNRKCVERQGKIVLVDARRSFAKLRRPLGKKRKVITESQIDEITQLFTDAALRSDSPTDRRVRVFEREYFGYQAIVVDRPQKLVWELTDTGIEVLQSTKAWQAYLERVGVSSSSHDTTLRILAPLTGRRFHTQSEALAAIKSCDLKGAVTQQVEKAMRVLDPNGSLATDSKGRPIADSSQRETEYVPLPDGLLSMSPQQASAALETASAQFLEREILPRFPDAWIDESKTKVAYEIPLTRFFERYRPPSALADVDAQIADCESNLQEQLKQVLRATSRPDGNSYPHSIPPRVRRTPLRDLFVQRKETGRPELPLLGVSVANGVKERVAGDGRPEASADLGGYKVVYPDDIIMNALGKPHGSIGVSSQIGITSPAYWVLIPNQELVTPRFAHYLLRSYPMVCEYKRLGKFLPPNQFDLSFALFQGIEAPLPSLEEQRTITKLLDEGQLLDKTLEDMRQLLSSRWDSLFVEMVFGVNNANPFPKGVGNDY